MYGSFKKEKNASKSIKPILKSINSNWEHNFTKLINEKSQIDDGGYERYIIRTEKVNAKNWYGLNDWCTRLNDGDEILAIIYEWDDES